MQRPPITQEINTAGPALNRPFCAPNSQPDPMIEPIDAQSRPIRPMSRASSTFDLPPLLVPELLVTSTDMS